MFLTTTSVHAILGGGGGLKNSNMSIAFTQNSIFNYSFVCFVKKKPIKVLGILYLWSLGM